MWGSWPCGLFVPPFGISLLAHSQWSVDEHSDASVSANQLPCHFMLSPEWRNDGGDHGDAGVHHQLGDISHAADVLAAAVVNEWQILAEALAYVVATKDVWVPSPSEKLDFSCHGDRRLVRARHTRESDHCSRVTAKSLTVATDGDEILLMEVLASSMKNSRQRI